MTQTVRLPFGTALALAQRTLTAPLAAVLADEVTTMPQWFTLNALGLRGPLPVAELAGLLATNGLDDADVRQLLTGLTGAGLIDVDAAGDAGEVVSLTAAGAARYVALRDRIGEVTRRLFDRFDPVRLETARALLQEIAETDAAPQPA